MASNEGFSVNENKSEVSSISSGAVNNDPKKLGIENGVDVVVEVVVVAAVVVEIAVVGLVLKIMSYEFLALSKRIIEIIFT